MLHYGRKNPLPFSFSKRSPLSDFRQTKKQRETGVKRVETVGVYPLAPAADAANLPAKGWHPFYMRRKQRNRSLRLAQTAIVC